MQKIKVKMNKNDPNLLEMNLRKMESVLVVVGVLEKVKSAENKGLQAIIPHLRWYAT